MDEQMLRSLNAVARIWTRKTLDDLKTDALLEDTGIAYDAVRGSDGRRMCLAVCLTCPDDVQRVRESLGSIEVEFSADWSQWQLAGLWKMASESPFGMSVKALSSDGHDWRAVALIAAVPDSITKLEQALSL